ncbi:MAG TPA: hypothetical protein PKH98_04940, partial [Candidatus Omnitrophota bacterium]|nr:hypothetical protein [Candidatus Omnitrophota bacterium]
RPYTPDLKVFTGMERMGMYEMALQVKNYLIDEIMNKRLGKVVVIYSWPKTLDVQKERVVNLLPCKELISKQVQFVDFYEKAIWESEPVNIIGYLANLWVTVRLHEIFLESNIAAAAALASFLEESVDKMKKEKIKAQMKYRKARKNDIDKSLRETFSARMMSIDAK